MDLRQVERAAFLRSRGVMPPGIAQLLGRKIPYVIRLLKEAKKRNLLQESHPKFLASNLQTDNKERRLRELESDLRVADLQKRLRNLVKPELGKSNLRDVMVFESTSKDREAEEWRLRQERFSRASSDWIYKMIRHRSKVVCVAWGQQISSLISAMKELPDTRYPARESRKTFLPARGDPLGVGDPRTSSSALCQQLAELFCGQAESLAGTPAVIPKAFENRSDAIRVIKEFAEHSPAFRKIYGSGGIIKTVDTILTSVGVPTEAGRTGFGSLTRELIRTLGDTENWIKENVLGDIAGVFEPQPGKEKESQKMQTRWLGLERTHLADCANAARAKRHPGVIVATVGGQERARLLKALIQENLINYLAIDFECYEQLDLLVE